MSQCTCWAGVDVHHLALGTPQHVSVLHGKCDGLDKYGILRPGLQIGQKDPGVRVLVLTQLHIHHAPAVGAAAILPVKLCDVLERPGETQKR